MRTLGFHHAGFHALQFALQHSFIRGTDTRLCVTVFRLNRPYRTRPWGRPDGSTKACPAAGVCGRCLCGFHVRMVLMHSPHTRAADKAGNVVAIGLHKGLQRLLQHLLQDMLQKVLQTSLRKVLYHSLFLGDVAAIVGRESRHAANPLYSVEFVAMSDNFGRDERADLNESGLSNEIDSAEVLRDMVSTPQFPVEFEGVEPLQMFSMEHWIVLYAKGMAPEPPLQLSPFPLQVHSEDELMNNLAEWELIKGTMVDADLLYILESLSYGYTHAIFGAMTLPQRAQERTLVIPGDVMGTGRDTEEQYVEQPTYPYMIVKTFEDVIISAVSMETGITFNVSEYTEDNYAEAFARELAMIVDAEGTWPAATVASIHVPKEAAVDSRVPSLLSEDVKEQQDTRSELMSEYMVHKDTLVNLGKIISLSKLVSITVTPSIRLKDDSLYSHSEGSGMWVLAEDKEGKVGSYVTTPEIDANEHEKIFYGPYDEVTLRRMVLESFKTTAHILKKRGLKDTSNQFLFLVSGRDVGSLTDEFVLPPGVDSLPKDV